MNEVERYNLGSCSGQVKSKFAENLGDRSWNGCEISLMVLKKRPSDIIRGLDGYR